MVVGSGDRTYIANMFHFWWKGSDAANTQGLKWSLGARLANQDLGYMNRLVNPGTFRTPAGRHTTVPGGVNDRPNLSLSHDESCLMPVWLRHSSNSGRPTETISTAQPTKTISFVSQNGDTYVSRYEHRRPVSPLGASTCTMLSPPPDPRKTATPPPIRCDSLLVRLAHPYLHVSPVVSKMGKLASRIRLPKDALIYTRSVFDRSRDLIAYNIWSGLQPHRLDAWINNFVAPEERYLAAKILDALIYRPKPQTIALLQHLFQRTIPDLQRSRKISPFLLNIYPNMTKSVEPHVRIVPVLIPGQPAIKSGAIVGRYLRRSLGFRLDWFLDISQIQDTLDQGNVVIFIDDFLGTGNQFIEFVADAQLQSFLDTGMCVYTPLVAHVDGIQRLKKKFTTLCVVAAEVLDETHALFGKRGGEIFDEVNSVEVVRDFYYSFLKSRAIDANAHERRGFGYFELVYAFEDAVPDNSLPILWWPHFDNWHPLFPR